MVEGGEASVCEILDKTSTYFDDMVKLASGKGAMTYPVAVIGLAVILVNVLLVAVIPVFAEMFTSGAELPKPTQMLINLSSFLKSYHIHHPRAWARLLA